MATNPYINKVVYGGTTLIDLTSDTVTPATLAEGVTAHNASGELITGTMKGGGVTTDWAYLAGNSSATNYVRWRVMNNVVIVQVNYASGASVPASGSNKTFGTIPSGYRPDKTATFGATVSSNNVASIWVTNGGVVQGNQRASSSSGSFYGSVVYPIDS